MGNFLASHLRVNRQTEYLKHSFLLVNCNVIIINNDDDNDDDDDDYDDYDDYDDRLTDVISQALPPPGQLV